MAGNRIHRINEEIQRELSSLIRDLKDPRIKGLLSVTAVRTTNDLRYSKVFISPFGGQDAKDLLAGLKSASGFLRRELGIRLSLRYTPELIFTLDDSIKEGARIIDVLSELERGSGEDDDACDDE